MNTSRRTTFVATIVLLAVTILTPLNSQAQTTNDYRCPEWFRDAKFGIWSHWGPDSVPGIFNNYAHDLYSQGSSEYQWHLEHYGHLSQFGYKDVINSWKAEKFDPDALMTKYKAAGAKYFVALATHHDNFDNWDSKWHEWNSVKVGPHNRWPLRMRQANQVATPLNNALPGFLDQTRVEANRLLTTYFPNQRLVIQSLFTPGCEFAAETKELTGQTIQPDIEYNGRKVDKHEEFLNEARLTALGICMFLAALKLADSNPAAPDPLRLLVLDDVLIGLDLNNRLPLLECLRVEFPNHQTILLTYDELWFNMAREHTEKWGTWRSAEMFAELTGPNDPPIPRLKDTTDDLTVATRYLNTNEMRPAAVYVRSAFENKLRTVCEDKHVKLDFKQDPKRVSADTLWTAILARHAIMVGQGKEFLDPGIIPGIEATRSQVLNRLAHDGGVGLTRQDVLSSIDSMRRFRASTIPHNP